MDVMSVFISEDKAAVEKEDNELLGQDDAMISLQSCAVGLPRPVPPKPRQKSGSKPVVDHRSTDQTPSSPVAKDFCVNGGNSSVHSIVVSQLNSPSENASKNGETEEIIPPASAIILALEQEKLKRESLGTLEKKSGRELRTAESFSRRRHELTSKFESSKSFAIKKSADRKIRPQVPSKPFRVEQVKIQICKGSGHDVQKNSFFKEDEVSDCASPNRGCLSREEICSDRLPELFRVSTDRRPESGPECCSPLSACGRVRRSSALLDSSSSCSSLVDGQQNFVDIQQIADKLNAVVSLTAEDSEILQKARSSHLTSPSPSPVLQDRHGNRESGRPSYATHRRSRSLGEPVFCHRSFPQRSPQRPKVPAKPRSRMKQDYVDEPSSSSNSSTLIIPSPDHLQGEGTHTRIHQTDCFIFEWTNPTEDDKTSKSTESCTAESGYDIQCEATDAVTETSNERKGSIVEMFCTDKLEMQNVSNEVVTEVLPTGDGVLTISQTDSVGSTCDFQSDSSIQNDSGQKQDLVELIAKDCNDEKIKVYQNFSQIDSVFFDGVPTSCKSPESYESVSVVKTDDTSTESRRCLESFTEDSGTESRTVKTERIDDGNSQEFSEHLFSGEKFNLFSNTQSFADEIFQILPYDSGSSNSSIQPLVSETSGYGSVNSAGSSLDVSSQRRSSDVVSMAETLSTAVDNVHEEMKDMWAESNCKKNSGNKNLDNIKTLLRCPSSNSVETQKKLTNRKVSKAKSFKQWKRYTQKIQSSGNSVLPSERADETDALGSFRRLCSDGENSDSGTESDSNDVDFDESLLSPTVKKDVDRTKHQKLRSAFHVASELLATERNYVKKLHLVAVVFRSTIIEKNNSDQMFGDEIIPQIFSNITSIHSFHSDFLLPQLEKRMKECKDSDPRIGDEMKKFAPFLKLYTEYVKNFDTAISTINFWLERSVKFKKAIQEIQRRPECGHLNLQHHMLEPIQRVPRYQLLLKDYLRLLPQDSVDRPDTTEALELVTQAAWHSNEVMRKTEKFNKLIEINESLGGSTDLVCPTRVLVKEGKMAKISARDGSHRERYLFLFSDRLLICQSLPLKIGQKQQYRLKSDIEFVGMEALVEGCNLETANTFYFKGRQRSFEFHASSAEEKNDWMKAFKNAIAEFQKNYQTEMTPDLELGKRAPIWVKDPETSMCMCCSVAFTPFRRRHHCRACGDVICGKCSMGRAALVYNGNREKRVCDPCFQKLRGTVQLRKDSTESFNTISPSEEPFCRKGILQVKARDPAVFSGYMNMGCNKKNLSRRFFAIHEDFVMYSFKAHQDVVAMTSLPLPGYIVAYDDTDKRGFKVLHTQEKKVYYFQTEDESSRNRWVEALQDVVQLRLPKTSMNEPTSPT